MSHTHFCSFTRFSSTACGNGGGYSLSLCHGVLGVSFTWSFVFSLSFQSPKRGLPYWYKIFVVCPWAIFTMWRVPGLQGRGPRLSFLCPCFLSLRVSCSCNSCYSGVISIGLAPLSSKPSSHTAFTDQLRAPLDTCHISFFSCVFVLKFRLGGSGGEETAYNQLLLVLLTSVLVFSVLQGVTSLLWRNLSFGLLSHSVSVSTSCTFFGGEPQRGWGLCERFRLKKDHLKTQSRIFVKWYEVLFILTPYRPA